MKPSFVGFLTEVGFGFCFCFNLALGTGFFRFPPLLLRVGPDIIVVELVLAMLLEMGVGGRRCCTPLWIPEMVDDDCDCCDGDAMGEGKSCLLACGFLSSSMALTPSPETSLVLEEEMLLLRRGKECMEVECLNVEELECDDDHAAEAIGIESDLLKDASSSEAATDANDNDDDRPGIC